jgi:hypothetical protein
MNLRAGNTPHLGLANQQSRSLSKTFLVGQPASEISQSDYFHGTPQEAEALSESPPVQLSGLKQVTDVDLLT